MVGLTASERGSEGGLGPDDRGRGGLESQPAKKHNQTTVTRKSSKDQLKPGQDARARQTGSRTSIMVVAGRHEIEREGRKVSSMSSNAPSASRPTP